MEEIFNYTYSAKEQTEIRSIRDKYVAPEQTGDKLSLLRCLDGAVTKKATTAALTLGVVGTLLLGFGMSLAMTDIGSALGLQGGLPMLVGIPVGLAGILLVSVAYPAYNRILQNERKKIAPQILQLAEELMK